MSESLGRSTTVMAAGTAVSRVVGVLRLGVLAAAIGASGAGASAFGVANWLPNMLYMLIAGGVLNAVLVPQVVRAYRSAQGQEYVDRLLSLSIALLLGLTVLLTAGAPVIVWVAASGKDPAFLPLATAFALWCIPQVFFYGLYTLLGQVLNARGSFGPYMWAPVVNNVVSIIGFGVFIAVYGRYTLDSPFNDAGGWSAGPVALLGGTATLGIVTQALVLLWPLHRIGFRFRPRRDWRGTGLGTAGRVAGWTFAALLVGQVGIVVLTRVTTLAGQVAEHAPDVANNAGYTYAFTVFMLPHSLVTVSLLTAMFTRLSGHAAAGDVAAVRDDVATGLRWIGVFTLFATAVIAVLALPVVRIVLPSLEPEVAGSIAPVIVALTIGLVPLGVWSLVQRVAYAYEDARGLFWIQVAMSGVVVTGAVLAWQLAPVRWWTAAASAGIAASYLLGGVWGALTMRARLGGSGTGFLRAPAMMYLRAGVAALAAAGVGWPLLRAFGDPSRMGFLVAAGVCVLVGLVMLGVYAGLLRLLGVPDLEAMASPALRRLAPLGARVTGAVGGVGRTMGSLSARASGPQGKGVPVDSTVGQGTLLAGRYRLEHPQPYDMPGAECWTARDQILDRTVRAVLLRSGRVAEAQDAARRAALVNDPRLLRVIDVGHHEDLAYVVTDRITGRDLGQLTAQGPLPADQARAIIGEAAVALEVARRRGVHHLALRPSCLHVGPTGKVVVSGLAMDGELGEHGLGDARSTTRADTVGLVALLYLALTGRWPSPTGGRMHDVAPAPLLSGHPVAPAEIVSGVPNDLDTLCSVTLGPYDDGPHSPAELVRELEPWGSVTAVEPRPRTSRPSRDADTATDTPAVPALGAMPPEVAEAIGAAAPADGVPVVATGAPEGEAAEPEALEAEALEAEPEVEAPETEPEGAVAAEPGEPEPDADTTGEEADADPHAADEAPVDPADDATADGGAPTAPVDLPADLDGEHNATPVLDGEHETTEDASSAPSRLPVLGVRPVPPRRPGTPPPAILPRMRPTDPRVAAATSAPASVTVPLAGEHEHPDRPVRTSARRPSDDFALLTGEVPRVSPSTDQQAAPEQPVETPPHEHHAFEEIIGVSADLLVRKRFNPTPLVLLLVAIAIGIGLVWAWNAVQAPAGSLMGDGPSGILEPSTDPATEPTDGTGGETGEPAPPATDPPVIAGALQIDPPPSGDNNEHPELVGLAIDGNPGTSWLSRTYASPTYGMKPGIGYAVTLQAPAVVTKVTLITTVSGGNVEVRATDPSTPTEGEVLASGPLSATTELVLSQPTETSVIVLWFTALPQTADGRNRVELGEVQVG